MPLPSHKLSLGTLVALTLLLLTHFGLAVGSKLTSSTATDELVHLTAGVAYWRTGDFRLHPENGNLSQRWAALPAALSDAPFPSSDNQGWQHSDAWATGYAFFYGSDHDHFPMLMSGRVMIALLSVATGLIVFLWARALFGTASGLFALTLYTFCPDTLTHGALVTSDMAMTLFFLGSLALFWRHLHSRSITLLLLSCLVFGLAWVAKYSALTLLPVFGLLGILRVLNPAPLNLGKLSFHHPFAKLLALTGSLALHGLVTIGVIWLFYGCRYSAFAPASPPLDRFITPWAQLTAHTGLPGQVLQELAKLKVLPEAFLYGFTYVLRTIQYRSAFLDGQFSSVGWPSYFLLTFLYKTPLSLFVIIVGSLMIYLRKWLSPHKEALLKARHDLYRLSPLWIFFSVYWLLSITSHLNIGHRHILPTYPILFILAGVLFAPRFLRRPKLRPLFKWALAAAFAVESLAVFPHFLSYFNPIAGGPTQGWRHLVDSSSDWGQDLPSIAARIKELQKDPQNGPIFLSYFGAGQHSYYGIHAEMLPSVNLFSIRYRTARLRAGTYCISATMLQQVYSPAQGPWTADFEMYYQKLAPLEPLIYEYQHSEASHLEMDKNYPDGFWNDQARLFDELRFARLCHYLRAKGPDEVIAGSFLVFHLSQTELDRCLKLPSDAWSPWIKAVQASGH